MKDRIPVDQAEFDKGHAYLVNKYGGGHIITAPDGSSVTTVRS